MLDMDARPEWNAIVARWDGSYELDFAPGNFANLVVRNEANTFGVVAGASPSGRALWHHLVGIFSGGVMSIYVNGVKGAELNLGGGLRDGGPSPDRVMIGATRSGTVSSLNFKGLIDEVALYDYGLSAAQVRGHFRAAQPPAPPTLSIESSVRITWPSFPPGYQLMAAPKLEGPEQAVTHAPTSMPGGLLQVVLPTDPAQRYFRLEKP
jgi:hypothetical protein